MASSTTAWTQADLPHLIPERWRPLPAAEWPELSGVVALDTETRDPLLKQKGPGWCFEGQGQIIGVSLAWEGGSDYFPFSHAAGADRVDKKQFLGWLRRQMAKPDLTVVMHNSLYDAGWLRREDIHVRGRLLDTMVMAAVHNETLQNYSLDTLAKLWAGIGKDERSLHDAARRHGIDPKQVKANLWRLPGADVAPYAIQDARATLALYRYLAGKLDHPPEAKVTGVKVDLWKTVDFEMSLIPMLLDMRERGVRVDVERTKSLIDDFQTKVDKETKILESGSIDLGIKAAGGHFSPWSSEHVARSLRNNGVALDGETERDLAGERMRGVSFKRSKLEEIDHPVARMIVDIRKRDKLIKTFLQGGILDHQVNGRVHCQFHPTRGEDGGTVTFRFASSNFNLQNLPARDEKLGKPVRECFLPEEGDEWVAIDFSSQEPRLSVHYAGIARAKGAEVFVGAYNDNPDLDFHLMGAKVAHPDVDFSAIDPKVVKKYRSNSKDITLGRMYGMGGAKLCRRLGLPTKQVPSWKDHNVMIEVAGDEGQAILDNYDRNMPFVKDLTNILISQIRARQKAVGYGFLVTLMGHVVRFKDDMHMKHGAYEYMALNRLIQTSAAGMTKKAMLDLYRNDILPLVTVHDEVGLSLRDESKIYRAKELMEGCVPLCVPTRVDIERGMNWGSAK